VPNSRVVRIQIKNEILIVIRNHPPLLQPFNVARQLSVIVSKVMVHIKLRSFLKIRWIEINEYLFFLFIKSIDKRDAVGV
jgi:hypothetical protein